jgi:DNA mismatch endonuclease (patch repair protein)
MDHISRARRSWLMARVKSRDTKPEMLVRRTVHSWGYRYRLHASDLPGKPDIVFRPRRRVIFVHGCYWHGHSCKYGIAQPKTNREFWEAKLLANRVRDARVQRLLRSEGWKVLIVWECETKKSSWQQRTRRFLDLTTEID